MYEFSPNSTKKVELPLHYANFSIELYVLFP